MNYRIVQMVEGRLIQTEPTDIYAWADVAGIDVIEPSENPYVRAELRDQPRLADFAGPMWDGDAVRYEDKNANRRISA